LGEKKPNLIAPEYRIDTGLDLAFVVNRAAGTQLGIGRGSLERRHP
jgi:hypothetical protein